MVEVLPWGQPSVERHGWLIGWLRITFPIVEWFYHVTSMKESNIILILYFGPRVLDLGFWSLGFWSLDLYIKSESLFIVIHSL